MFSVERVVMIIHVLVVTAVGPQDMGRPADESDKCPVLRQSGALEPGPSTDE